MVSEIAGWGLHGGHGPGAVTGLCLGQVQENSPAQQAGLEPYFDFIITIGHSRLVSSHTLLCFAVCVCPAAPQEAPAWFLLPFSSGGRPSLISPSSRAILA